MLLVHGFFRFVSLELCQTPNAPTCGMDIEKRGCHTDVELLI